MRCLEDQKMAHEIARLVDAKGGRTFYVGGFVRDALLGRENKDVDIVKSMVLPSGCWKKFWILWDSGWLLEKALVFLA